MCGVFAKSGVRVHILRHVTHFLSIFGSVHDYRCSTFVCREYDDGVIFFSVSVELPSPLTDVKFREFSSFDGTYNLPSEFFCRGLSRVFRDYLSTDHDCFDREGSRVMAKFKPLLGSLPTCLCLRRCLSLLS